MDFNLIKTEDEIKRLREGGKILAKILRELSEKVVPGVSTLELENYARELISKFDARPAFLGYTPVGSRRAFPAALCVSVNSEIVHGIPNEKPKILREGDIVSIDCGIEYKKMFTDSALTVPCGQVDERGRLLLKATKEALAAGIKVSKPGKKTGDIGAAIERVAKKYGFQIADDLGGHGVGRSPHEDPFIPNFGIPKSGVALLPGLVIAIEPMLNEGTSKVKFLSDGYTFVTADNKRSAHFEHTILITKDGPEILTQ